MTVVLEENRAKHLHVAIVAIVVIVTKEVNKTT